MVDTSDEWIVQRTGIRERHIAAEDESTSDLALQAAAQRLLNKRTRPDAEGLLKIARRWQPHRGVAARVLWAYYSVPPV